MNWSFEFNPLLPQSLLIIVGVIALALAAFLLLRSQRGALLRLLSLAALVLALINPSLKQEERDKLSNIAVVVVDESASQKIAGRKARSEKALADLEAKLAAIDNLDVQVVRATPPKGAQTTRANDGTLLFSSLNSALSNIPPNRLSGAFLITDGQIHDVPKQASQLGFDAPVHTILNGAPDEFDRRIKIIKAPRFGIVGSEANILLSIDEFGRRSPKATDITQLTIRREGQPDETRPVLIGDSIKVPFSFPHAGPNIVEIELATASGELTDVNNRIVISAEGVRENLRVLLVSGEPHAGERTWRNLLKSDAAVDLVHFTILRPPEKQDGTPIHQLSLIEFPTRELFSEKLNDFDLIIFDRYQRRGVLPMLYLDNIARYVSEGGAVLIAAGEDFARPRSLFRTPLYQIIPAAPTGRILEEPFKAEVTKVGKRHPVTRDLDGAPKAGSPDQEPSWGRWFRIIDVEPSSGSTVMSGTQKKPLLVLDRKEKGRVALLTSDHAWLWARGYEGGGPHTQLLRRLFHWLMKDPDLEEEFITARTNGMSLEIERRTMGEKIAPVTITGPDGKTSTLTLKQTSPGVWAGALDVEIPGLYRTKSEKLEAIAHVGLTNSREMTEVITSGEKLEAIKTATKAGAVFLRKAGTPPEDIGSNVAMPRISMLRSASNLQGRGWLGLRERDAYLTKGVKVFPLFTGPFALAALLALFALTWYREGR